MECRAHAIRSSAARADRRPRCPWLALAGVLVLAAGVAQAQSVREDFFITNGQVTAQALRGNTLYVGGSFSFVGPGDGRGRARGRHDRRAEPVFRASTAP
jgi:hypothetical protein